MAGPKWNNAQLWMCLVMKVKSNAVKKQCCLRTWNDRSMNQDKLDVVKQEMARININILGISELNDWEWANLIQMIILLLLPPFCGQESHRINGVALRINKQSLKYSTWVQPQK